MVHDPQSCCLGVPLVDISRISADYHAPRPLWRPFGRRGHFTTPYKSCKCQVQGTLGKLWGRGIGSSPGFGLKELKTRLKGVGGAFVPASKRGSPR